MRHAYDSAVMMAATKRSVGQQGVRSGATQDLLIKKDDDGPRQNGALTASQPTTTYKS